MLSKIHINNKYFVLFVLGLLGFAAIKAMQGLANIDSTSHNNTNFYLCNYRSVICDLYIIALENCFCK